LYLLPVPLPVPIPLLSIVFSATLVASFASSTFFSTIAGVTIAAVTPCKTFFAAVSAGVVSGLLNSRTIADTSPALINATALPTPSLSVATVASIDL